MIENTNQAKALVKTDVSSSLSISEIKKRLDNCIDLYTDLFCQKQEVYADGWIGEIKGGINCFADAFFFPVASLIVPSTKIGCNRFSLSSIRFPVASS